MVRTWVRPCWNGPTQPAVHGLTARNVPSRSCATNEGEWGGGGQSTDLRGADVGISPGSTPHRLWWRERMKVHTRCGFVNGCPCRKLVTTEIKLLLERTGGAARQPPLGEKPRDVGHGANATRELHNVVSRSCSGNLARPGYPPTSRPPGSTAHVTNSVDPGILPGLPFGTKSWCHSWCHGTKFGTTKSPIPQ